MDFDKRGLLGFLLIVLLGSTGIFILKETPFQELINWITSLILISSSIWVSISELLRCVQSVVESKLKHIKNDLKRVEENFNSTVKTLTFFYNSNKKEQVRLSNIFSEETDEIEEGEVEMRTIPKFLNSRSFSVVVMEGKEDSALKSHFHDRDVVLFVVDGNIKIETSQEVKTLSEGDSYKVVSGARRELNFLEDSTIILTYKPPLKRDVN